MEQVARLPARKESARKATASEIGTGEGEGVPLKCPDRLLRRQSRRLA
jgi:hypothetical protein